MNQKHLNGKHKNWPREEFAEIFQNQTEIPLWIFDDVDLIRGIAEKRVSRRRGKRGLIQRWFNHVGSSWMGLCTLVLLSVLRTLWWWIKTRQPGKARSPAPTVLLLDHGAGAGTNLVRMCKDVCGEEPLHLSMDRPEVLKSVARPSLNRLIRLCIEISWSVVRAIRSSGLLEVKNCRAWWMTSATLALPLYVFFRAWGESLPPSVREVVLTVPVGAAQALLDSRKEVQRPKISIYQHGLLRRELVFPSVDRMYVLTKIEEGYLKRRIPATDLVVVSRPSPVVVPLERVAMVVSMYEFDTFSKNAQVEKLGQLLAWLKSEGFKAVVRPHPLEQGDFWAKHFPEVTLDASGLPFSDLLWDIKPMIVVTWFSTGMVDALRSGILPVTLSGETDEDIQDLILPLEEIAVMWPKQENILQRLLSDSSLYRDEVAFRQTRVFGGGRLDPKAASLN